MSLKRPYAATAYGLFKFIKHQSTSDLDIATHFFRPRNERKHLSSISLLRLRLLPEILSGPFLPGNTFLRQRPSCKSTCQHFFFLEFAEYFHNFVINSFFFARHFTRIFHSTANCCWNQFCCDYRNRTFFLWHKTCSLKLAEKNEQWIATDVTTELRTVLNWQSARSIQIGFPLTMNFSTKQHRNVFRNCFHLLFEFPTHDQWLWRRIAALYTFINTNSPQTCIWCHWVAMQVHEEC